MRIATWNVNSLKARQEAVERWLDRAAPDVLLIQETKLTDEDAPVMAFAMAGYELVHHGEGRWNGVAIAARDGLADRRRRHELRRRAGARQRVRAARVGCRRGGLRPVRRGADGAPRPWAGIRVVQPLRAERPGRRIAVLRRQARLVRAAAALARRDEPTRGDAARARRRPQRRADRRSTSGTPRPCTAAPTSPSPNARRSGRCSTGAWPTRYRAPARRAGPLLVVGLPGRQVPQELRDADRPPAGRRRRWRHGSSTPRSTARRARARRSRPTTRRCRSTSTSRAGRSIRIGKAPSPGSRHERSAEGLGARFVPRWRPEFDKCTSHERWSE